MTFPVISMALVLLPSTDAGLCATTDDLMECRALVDFKAETNFMLEDWANGDTYCNWSGVTCDSNANTVTALDLSDRNLTGNIPDSIGNLANLQRLDISHQMQERYHYPLPFGTNGLPEGIRKLTLLTYLDLSYNDLVGPIPDYIGDLTQLTHLYLNNNNPLGGGIPSSFAKLSNLVELSLSHTQITGNIPDAIESLTALEYLDLSHCILDGPIPSLEALSNLKHLNLTGNNFDIWTSESICNLVYVGHLDDCKIYGNPLQCPIPYCAKYCQATCVPPPTITTVV